MIQFIPFAERHLSIFRQWLAAPHVRAHWTESEDESELRAKFLGDLPDRGFHPFVFEVDGRAVGYIQYYEACRAGGGWWSDARPGEFGIDLFIGESDALGCGVAVLQEFMRFVCLREPSVREFIIDPAPGNLRAIRAFEKAGFRRVGLVETPGGRALLMRRVL